MKNKLQTFNNNMLGTLIDDIKKEKDESLEKIWDADKIEAAREAFFKGKEYELGNPWYDHKHIGKLRRGDIIYKMNRKERKEFKKCAKDIIYFAEKYCKIKTEKGHHTHFKLRPYQKKFLKMTKDNRFCIYLASRQIGKSVMTAIVLLHYICFNTEKNVLLTANKLDTVKEIMQKIKDILHSIPYFLQPGCYINNQKGMIFDNDCRIHGTTTTEDTSVGFTIDLLFADEFAKVPDNIKTGFWKSIYPTLTSIENSKCIITSTPDGLDLFYEIYTRATKELNNFSPMVTYWDEVPGRDNEWKKKVIADLAGGEGEFAQEFGCQFISSSRLLIDRDTLQQLNDQQIEFSHQVVDELEDIDDLNNYDELIWQDNYDDIFEGIEDKRFLLSIDLAHGIGGDYSVINIFEMVHMTEEEIDNINKPKTEADFIKLEQRGLFRSNTTSKQNVADITMGIVYLLGIESCLINFEVNQGGDYFLRCLEEDEEFYIDMLVHTKHRMNSTYEQPGVKIKTQNKKDYCTELRALLRKNQINVYEFETIEELKKFGLNKAGSYSCQTGHDDIASTLVLLPPAIKSTYYIEMIDDILIQYDKKILDKIYKKLEVSDDSDYVDYKKVMDEAYAATGTATNYGGYTP